MIVFIYILYMFLQYKAAASNFTLNYSSIDAQKIVDIHTFPHSAQITPVELSYNSGLYRMVGYQPTTPSDDGYPLFVYVTGTDMSSTSQSAISYTQYMAEKGFVAVSVQYANAVYPVSCGQFRGKAELLWNSNNVESALSTLCSADALSVDCDAGILTSGMSQGLRIIIVL